MRLHWPLLMQVGGEEGGVIDGKKVTSCYKLKNQESVICSAPVILGQMFAETHTGAFGLKREAPLFWHEQKSIRLRQRQQRNKNQAVAEAWRRPKTKKEKCLLWPWKHKFQKPLNTVFWANNVRKKILSNCWLGIQIFPQKANITLRNSDTYFSDQGRFFPKLNASSNHDGGAEQHHQQWPTSSLSVFSAVQQKWMQHRAKCSPSVGLVALLSSQTRRNSCKSALNCTANILQQKFWYKNLSWKPGWDFKSETFCPSWKAPI